MNELEKARDLLDSMGEPERTDAEVGMYWLARTYLHMAEKKSLLAMEGAVRSFVFETKDIDTFPDALILSAQCYEKLGQWHRARDVYYEVASLFERMHWGQYAMSRLRYIVDKDLTGSKEDVKVQKVFFDIEEDMNALVNELLGRDKDGSPKKKQPEKDDQTDDNEKK